MGNTEIVLAAIADLFGAKDPAAVDRWVAPDYRQHSSLAADGPEALRGLVASLGPDFRHELVRVIEDGDLVALHGVYYGFGPDPLVAIDLFRVRDGKLAEHWDALQPLVTETASGRGQTDGPTAADPGADTEANRKLVIDFVDTVLVGGAGDRVTDFISTTQYDQHNPQVADGLAGLGATLQAWAEQGVTMVYTTTYRSVAQGDFVLTQSQGTFGGTPTAFYDIFRVADGKIVEHWDVVFEIPAELPHDNGLF